MAPTSLLIFVAMAAMTSTTTSRSIVRHESQHKTHRLEYEDQDFQNIVDAEDERKALEHTIAVAEVGSCSDPKPQVIHISDHYDDSTKYYLPGCTILHRCGKHAGCCGSDRLQCVAAKKDKVTLYFYSVKIFGEALPAEQKVEKLVFTNHTRCGCVLKKDDHFRGDSLSKDKHDDQSLEKMLVDDDFGRENGEEEASRRDDVRDDSANEEETKDSNLTSDDDESLLDDDLGDVESDETEGENVVDETE